MAIAVQGYNGGHSVAKKNSREIERRRRRRKQQKKKSNQTPSLSGGGDGGGVTDTQPNVVVEIIEYIPEKVEDIEDAAFLDEYFKNVLHKFSDSNTATATKEDDPKKDEELAAAKKKAREEDEEEQDAEEKEKGGISISISISNKKKKLQRRMKIAELKKLCSRPDAVEVSDPTAAHPKLLVFLKSYRNTVPVPRHWCDRKRRRGKRAGIERPPFRLPDFIAATGVEKIREKEEDSKKKRKQKQPKMGEMVIDYQVLYDAFFKYQTKPKLTSRGDLYHEGKEFDKLREMKPGMPLSHKLKEALGMPDGAPPPWLINMQRYGPPPSYPHLKIPPLYGDVFGVQQQDQPNYEEEPVDRSKHWGDLEEEKEQMEEEEMEEEGIQSVDDSLSCTPTGVETPDVVIDLRKQQPEKPIYQLLEEKEERIAPGTLLGTTHTYVVLLNQQDKKAADAKRERVDLLRGHKADRVDVTIQPEELEVMDDVLATKYEIAREEEKLRNHQEGSSDMVAEAEKKRKRKMQHDKEGKSNKKDFKF